MSWGRSVKSHTRHQEMVFDQRLGVLEQRLLEVRTNAQTGRWSDASTELMGLLPLVADLASTAREIHVRYTIEEERD